MYSNQILNILFACLAFLGLVAASPQNRNGQQNTGNNAQNGANNGQQNGGNNNGNNAGGATLNAANIQAASNSNGNPNQAEGQAASETDANNFINFCQGKQITNGAQVRGGSCNGIVMGDIPAQNNIVSSIIINPAPGENIQANTDFDVEVQIANLVAGVFTNPDNTYYAAPQQLQGGKVVGHCHVTIQDLGGNIAATTPPNGATFAFFKGINDDGNGQGRLKATVTGGLAAGNYRVCTMNSASNHQPVLMPIAQRGAQDDCTKFTVGGNGGNANAGNNGQNGANNGQQNAGNNGQQTNGNNAGTQNNGGTGNNVNAGSKANENGGNGNKNSVSQQSSSGAAAVSAVKSSATSATSSAAAAVSTTKANGQQGGKASASTVVTSTTAAAAAATTSVTGNRNRFSGFDRGQRGRTKYRYQDRD